MSRTNPTKFEAEELAYSCRKCGVPDGEWCITKGGYWSGYLHSSRHRQVWDARRERDQQARTPPSP